MKAINICIKIVGLEFTIQDLIMNRAYVNSPLFIQY
jgi:hypothetical protein